jgi:hypothetical protein
LKNAGLNTTVNFRLQLVGAEQRRGRQHRFDPRALKARPIIAEGNALGRRYRFDPRALKARPMIVLSTQSHLAGRAFSAHITRVVA